MTPFAANEKQPDDLFVLVLSGLNKERRIAIGTRDGHTGDGSDVPPFIVLGTLASEQDHGLRVILVGAAEPSGDKLTVESLGDGRSVT